MKLKDIKQGNKPFIRIKTKEKDVDIPIILIEQNHNPLSDSLHFKEVRVKAGARKITIDFLNPNATYHLGFHSGNSVKVIDAIKISRFRDKGYVIASTAVKVPKIRTDVYSLVKKSAAIVIIVLVVALFLIAFNRLKNSQITIIINGTDGFIKVSMADKTVLLAEQEESIHELIVPDTGDTIAFLSEIEVVQEDDVFDDFKDDALEDMQDESDGQMPKDTTDKDAESDEIAENDGESEEDEDIASDITEDDKVQDEDQIEAGDENEEEQSDESALALVSTSLGGKEIKYVILDKNLYRPCLVQSSSYSPVSSLANSIGAAAAINAGAWNEEGDMDYTYSNGSWIDDTNTAFIGDTLVYKSGSFDVLGYNYITKQDVEGYSFALTAYNAIIQNYAINNLDWKEEHNRSFIGQLNNGDYVIGTAQSMNYQGLYNFAKAEFGSSIKLLYNLDGGGSVGLYVDGNSIKVGRNVKNAICFIEI